MAGWKRSTFNTSRDITLHSQVLDNHPSKLSRHKMSKGGRGAAHNVLMLKKAEDRRQEAILRVIHYLVEVYSIYIFIFCI